MKKNTATAPLLSSGKERHHEKTFKIPISNGIFEHYGRLKDARWLLDLFVDWTTKEVPTTDGGLDGIVLGGKPIRDEDTAGAFRGQCSVRTTRRWRQRLSRYGYISQKRTPVGYVIRVMKSKKWVRLGAESREVIGQKWPDRPAKYGRSEVPVVAGQIGHDRQFRTSDHGRFNKDNAVQSKDRAVEEAIAAATTPSDRHNSEEWKVIGQAPVGTVKFQKVWEAAHHAKLPTEKMSDAMERCIIACQRSSISVPRRFFDAKRRVESAEQGEVVSAPSGPQYPWADPLP